LRQVENVDLVVQLSHSGVWKNKSNSEDEITAKAVNGIDIIISGHTHYKLDKPIVVNDTLIVHTGMYGEYVGKMELEVDDGKVKLIDYKLNKIDDKIIGDAKIQAKIEDYIEYIDENYFSKYGLSFNQAVAETRFDLLRQEAESTIGSLVADAILWRVNQLQYNPEDPSSRTLVAIESNGVVRDDILKGKTGKIQAGDVFNVSPLGIGMDDTLGYPLLTFYITAGEIKDVLEVMTTVAPLKSSLFNLHVAGIKFTYNPYRMFFDRVNSIKIKQEDGSYQEVDFSSDNKKLYKVAANQYITSLLGLIESFTKGILVITPKDKNGNPITNLRDAIVDNDPNLEGIQETKQWIANIKYMQSFTDTDGNGLPNLPDRYQDINGRSLAIKSWNPINILSNPAGITKIAIGIVLGLFALLIFIVRYILKRKSN